MGGPFGLLGICFGATGHSRSNPSFTLAPTNSRGLDRHGRPLVTPLGSRLTRRSPRCLPALYRRIVAHLPVAGSRQKNQLRDRDTHPSVTLGAANLGNCRGLMHLLLWTHRWFVPATSSSRAAPIGKPRLPLV